MYLKMVTAKCLPFCRGLNILRPRQNCHHFPDNIFKCIFLNKNGRISIKISLKFVPKVPINNIAALVQIMAWHRPGDKLLSESMTVSLLTHICITRPQWVNMWQVISHCLNLYHQHIYSSLGFSQFNLLIFGIYALLNIKKDIFQMTCLQRVTTTLLAHGGQAPSYGSSKVCHFWCS